MKEAAAASGGFLSTSVSYTVLRRTWQPNQWSMPSRSSQARESETQRHMLLRAAMVGPVLCSWQDKSKKGLPSPSGDCSWLERLLQKSEV